MATNTSSTGSNDYENIDPRGNPGFKLNSQHIESRDQLPQMRGPKTGSFLQVGDRLERNSKRKSRISTTMDNLSSVVHNDGTKNGYETKKTIAQSCMNVALLAENAKNLKYLFTNKDNLVFYVPLSIGLSLSIIIQLVAGCLCGYLITLDVEQKEMDSSGKETGRPGPHVSKSRWANHVSSCLVLMATMINIIIGVTGFDDIFSNQFDF